MLVTVLTAHVTFKAGLCILNFALDAVGVCCQNGLRRVCHKLAELADEREAHL